MPDSLTGLLALAAIGAVVLVTTTIGPVYADAAAHWLLAWAEGQRAKRAAFDAARRKRVMLMHRDPDAENSMMAGQIIGMVRAER